MRDMINASPPPAWQFSRVTALGQFQRHLSTHAWCVTGITAVRHDYSSSCKQPAAMMAARAGVNSSGLSALIAHNPHSMPPDLARVWKFTRATPGRFDNRPVQAPADGAVRTA